MHNIITLSNLKKEPETTIQIVEYMEKLDKFWKAEYVF